MVDFEAQQLLACNISHVGWVNCALSKVLALATAVCPYRL